MFPMLSMLKRMIKLFCLQEFKVLKAAIRFLFQKMDRMLKLELYFSIRYK